MPDNAADVEQRLLRQARVAVAAKGVVATTGNGLVYVHTRAVVADQWLGHKGGRLAVSMGYVVHAVLEDLHLIGLAHQRIELDADLTLTGGAHFVVVYFDRQSHLLHRRAHGGADVM